MVKTLFSKFVLIVSVLALSALLLYPTLGPKKMVVEFARSTPPEKLKKIKDYYKKEGYDVTLSYKQKKFSKKDEKVKKASSSSSSSSSSNNDKKDGRPSLVFESFKLTLALANAIRIHPEVTDIFFSSTWIEEYLLAKQIKLGLDLQGGMHLLLQADYDEVIAKLKEDRIQEWKIENYDEKGLKPKKKDGLTTDDVLVLDFDLSPAQEKAAIENWQSDRQKEIDNLSRIDRKKALKLKKEPLILRLTKEQILNAKKRVIVQAREILNKRIDTTGVSEPSIRVIGNNSIEIQLPGVPNPKQAKQIIGSTGSVNYKLVDDKATNELLGKLKTIPNTPLTVGQYKSLRKSSLDLLSSKKNKDGKPLEVIFLFEKNKEGKYIPITPYVFEKEVRLKGDDIDKAWVGRTDEVINAVFFRLTSIGANKFADLTGNNINRRLGVIIDDQLYSNPPSIDSKIAGGQAYIRGNFGRKEAETVASIINEGALPVKLSIIEERTVGPSLGVESIEAGMEAILVSFVLVILIMVARYKVAGLIATFGLFSNFLILGALLSWLGFTLTLPGFAGLILTLGMAVDANVIIFERIREEMRTGKTIRSSINNGFDKAFSTIFDSNITTLLAALVLSQLGSGPIKGFAVTLSVGIISSMFTALYITRFIYDVIAEKKVLKRLSI